MAIMRHTLRDPQKKPRPDIGMRQSSFRTYRLNAVGLPNAAIRIASADPVFAQRVLVRHASANNMVFMGSDPAELEIPGQAIPMFSYGLTANLPTPVVLGPGQALWAVGSVAGMRVSVHTSQVIPLPDTEDSPLYDEIAEPVFRRVTLNVAGAPNAAVVLVTASPRPQRVIVNSFDQPGTLVYVSSGSEETLNTYPAAGPIPFAYEVGALEYTLFILAPGQHLEGVCSNPQMVLDIQAAEISLQRPPPKET